MVDTFKEIIKYWSKQKRLSLLLKMPFKTIGPFKTFSEFLTLFRFKTRFLRMLFNKTRINASLF